MKETIRLITRYVAFSCFVILFEVGYHAIIKDFRPVSDYIIQGIIFCLSIFVVDFLMSLWSKRRSKTKKE